MNNNSQRRLPLLRGVVRCAIPALCVACLLLPTALRAQIQLPERAIGDPVEKKRPRTLGDQVHEGASELLNDFASELDSFFAADVSSDIVNPTRATVRLDFSDQPNKSFTTRAKLKLRLVLPRSEQRFRLLLDVDDEDDDSNTSVENPTPEETEEAVSFAFRFIRNATTNTRFNVDLGARRFDQRFQTFARLRVSNKALNEDGWSFNLKNDLRFYAVSGYTNRLTFDFWHKIPSNESAIFRSSSSINWENVQDGAQLDQTVGYYNQLKHNSLLAFEVLAGYSTSPEEGESHFDGYTFRMRYRKNIFRPWFHYELWPSISWLTEDDGNPVLGGLIRTEVQFGNLKKY